MQLCNSTFPSVSEFVSEFVSELRRNVPNNALFYKNIIRNDKLRKLTSEDFFDFFSSNVPNEHGRSFETFHTSLFYKNIIRNNKLRKLTSVDFFKKKTKKIFTLLLLLSQMFPKELFLFYLIKNYEALPKEIF